MRTKSFYSRPEHKRRAKLQNVHFTQRADFVASDMDDDTFDKLLQAQLDNAVVQVLTVACNVDGDFEHDYHDVQLPDGTVIEALSGYHLDPAL